MVAQTARSAGAKVLIPDFSDYRLEIARRCGPEAISNSKTETLAWASEGVIEKDGYDVAFECVGVEATITAAVDSIQKGDTIIVVGVFGDQPRVNLALVQDRELNLRGTLMYQRQDYTRAIELIASGGILAKLLVSKHFSMDNYIKAYQKPPESPFASGMGMEGGWFSPVQGEGKPGEKGEDGLAFILWVCMVCRIEDLAV